MGMFKQFKDLEKMSLDMGGFFGLHIKELYHSVADKETRQRIWTRKAVCWLFGAMTVACCFLWLHVNIIEPYIQKTFGSLGMLMYAAVFGGLYFWLKYKEKKRGS